jgi:hypothetical protein
MKFTFAVGHAEKHRIDFFWSQFTGRSSLAVDGAMILQSGMTLTSPVRRVGKDEVVSGWKVRLPYALTRNGRWESLLPYPLWSDYAEIELVHRWTVEVGVTEQHWVRIEKERARWFAGIRRSKYRVFVDEQLIQEYRGY